MKAGSPYPQETASPSKAGRALTAIYPGWGMVEERESLMVGLPASASAYFSGGIRGGVDSNHDGGLLGAATSSDAAQITHVLPEDRSARYAVLRLMAKDPTIDSAVKMHIANALSARTDSGESVFISPTEGAEQDKIVDDLRATLMPFIRKDLNEWARKAAVYGSCFARVYGAQGIGIQNIRCDYYTHPRFIQKFEKGGGSLATRRPIKGRTRPISACASCLHGASSALRSRSGGTVRISSPSMSVESLLTWRWKTQQWKGWSNPRNMGRL